MTAALLRWLYPPRCQGCARLASSALCAACCERLPELAQPRCRRCGVFLDPLLRGPLECADCRGRQRDPLRLARAAAPYAGLPRELIHRLKYDRRRRAAVALGELWALWLAADAEANEALQVADLEALLPVPLHPWRQWRRGFNQAELLATELATLLARPVLTPLRRVRATRPQVGLLPAQRRANVAGAFDLAEPVARGGYYLLVDDVYTTGATLRECARVLRRAGAGAVAAVTVAHRSPVDHPGEVGRTEDHGLK
ncbi:MAG: ComF family protein [Fimbriimonadaceae bacterium]|nr:ComF family protein [Fimbriimonadaceae bacterium]